MMSKHLFETASTDSNKCHQNVQILSTLSGDLNQDYFRGGHVYFTLSNQF